MRKYGKPILIWKRTSRFPRRHPCVRRFSHQSGRSRAWHSYSAAAAPWEMLITFIISQRKSIPAIKRCVQQLCLRAGKPIRHAGHVFFAFPTPRRLAGLSMDELAACGLGYRAGYVHAAARLAASGALDLAALCQAENAALRRPCLPCPAWGQRWQIA